MTRSTAIFRLVTLVSCSAPAVASAVDPQCETAQFSPSPAGSRPIYFGRTIALEGDTLLCGAPLNSACDPGEVRVLRWNGSTIDPVEVLSASDASISDGFGSSVSMSGGVAAISAPGWGQTAGGVYILRYDSVADSWQEEQKLIPSGIPGGNPFLGPVAVSGDFVVIGAPDADVLGENSGAATVYRFDPIQGIWIEMQQLFAPFGQAEDRFGASVAADGGAIFVGAKHHDLIGAVFVYRLDPIAGMWQLEQELVASDPSVGAEFGFAVAASGGVVLVGAPFARDGAPTADVVGAAYVYRYDPISGGWTEEQKLLAADGVEGDQLGGAVAIRGDLAVAGAAWDDDLGYASGSVYVYRRDSVSGAWLEEQKLVAPSGQLEEWFGTSVAVDGGRIVGGAPDDDSIERNAGAAIAFSFDPTAGAWTPLPKIVPPDGGAAGDLHGSAVAISGEFALVGAPGDDGAGTNSGAAYVYRVDPQLGTWIEETKLTASTAAIGDNFACAVALDGDVAVVGASADPFLAPGTGSAFVFRRDAGTGSWVEEQRLVASAGTISDFFGSAVAVSGDVIAIGARGADDLGPATGAVTLFRRDPDSGIWIEVQRLVSPIGAWDGFGRSVSASGNVILAGSANGHAHIYRFHPPLGEWVPEQGFIPPEGDGLYFGFAVSVSGNLAIIGRYGDNEAAPSAGAAYVYRYGGILEGWDLEQKLLAPDAEMWTHFGGSVSVSGDVAMIGANHANALGPTSGSVYLFRFDPASGTWEMDRQLTAAGGASHDEFGTAVAVSGTRAVVGAIGHDDACASPCNSCNSGSAYLFDLSVCLAGKDYVRGDASGDGELDLADPILSISYLLAAAASTCSAALDANDDGGIDIADPIALLGFLFAGGSPPPAPFPDCGPDPAAGALPDPCDESPCP